MPSLQNIDKLVNFLIGEYPRYSKLIFPSNLTGKRQLMRSLLNLRPPVSAPEELINSQDTELLKQLHEKGIIELNTTRVSTFDNRLRLWQGDITRLKTDAIVNAANSQMLGCFVPNHSCIDNAIHSAAGIQLRLECKELMESQGYPEPTGSAKITSCYNLPSK